MIRTVSGDLHPDRLGIASCHDHLLIRGGILTKDADFRLDDLEKAVEELGYFKGAGGNALVDAIPPGLGRDPEGLRALSERTNLNIVAVTGFHKTLYYDSEHWLFWYEAKTIADLVTAEILDGMDIYGYRGPIVQRSKARAGAIKLATRYWQFNAVEEKLFEAVAMAQVRTGVPIITHTEDGTLGLEQALRLIALGVDPGRIVVGHFDKNPDPGLHLECLALGVNLQYDQPSRFKYGPDARVVDLLRRVVDAGFADRIVFGHDFAKRSYWLSYAGGPGMGYLLGRFVPRLRLEGFSEDVLERILRRNPARIFDRAVGGEA